LGFDAVIVISELQLIDRSTSTVTGYRINDSGSINDCSFAAASRQALGPVRWVARLEKHEAVTPLHLQIVYAWRVFP
jgi:hypothetical protein